MYLESKTINKCQISKKKDLKLLLSLGYLPPVNKLRKIGTLMCQDVFYPADLVYSKSSKLVQLSTIVDKKILFPKEYPYTSSTTKILRENFKELYKDCLKILKLNSSDLIIDIGSNDGNLLSNFKSKHKVLGVTPENIGKLARKKGIQTLIKYFDKSTSNFILRKFGKAKVITATNVFAHIDDLSSLMKNILKVLKNDGVFITESHYLVSLIKTNQYDTIYHEHLRYYSLTSLNFLFNKYGMEIIHAKKINTHGGSIRVYAAKKRNFVKFREKVVKSKISLYGLLKKIKLNNKTIYGIGAPSRASTLINYTGLDENIIDCVLEVQGSHKIGNYIPGKRIPILSEKKLYTDQPDFVLILSWHISSEIIKNLRTKGFKGKFIIPLPSPRIVI